jgi:zinc protease
MTHRTRRFLLSLTLLTASACHRNADKTDTPVTDADGPATADAEEALDLPDRPFDYQVSELDNGMKVITLEDHSTPIAAVQVWYHVGSKDERPDRRGFAHMFEHMMFRGTQNIGPKAHFEYIRKVGGDANAFTSFDNTTYIQVVPSHQVEMVLWLEAERMGFLKINDGYFDTERKVVAEEYRLGREQPYGTALEKVLEGVFTKHPYRWSPIGNMDELSAASAAELQTFWNTYYVPNNAALVVVGDVDHAEVEKLAQQYFGWIPRYDAPPRVTIKEPEQTKKKVIEISERNGPVPIAAIGWRTVPTGHKDELALEMLGQILGGGESSRLYEDLVTDRELAMVALSGGFALEDEGLFAAGAVLSPFGAKPDEALAAIREHVAKIRKDGVTEDELTKARNSMLRNAITSQLTVASKAQLLGDAAMIKGDLESVNRHFREVRDMTAARIQKAAEDYLTPEHEIEIRIEPNLLGFVVEQLVGGDKDGKGKDDGGAGAEEISGGGSGKPGLVRPASLGPTPTVAPPVAPDVSITAVEHTLDNGLKVVTIPNAEVPFVTFTLGLDYGAYADPAAKPGTASVALPMLTRGTKSHDYKTLANELDTHAISLGGSASMDAANVNASAVSSKAARAMGLLAEVVREPTFPKKELDQYVKQTRTGLAITERSPAYLADRELRRRMFPGHPYARLPEAQMEDLGAIEPADLQTWWSTHARPDSAVLYVAGDIEPARAQELAAEYFGDWKVAGAAPKVDVPPTPEPQKTKIYLVDRPANQSQIRVGHVGITRSSADWATANVLSDVLGGGFNSRLNDTIRVKKGLTYGAGGGFSAERFAGRFVVSTFSKNSTVPETVSAILDELRRIQKEAPSPTEESDSRSYLLGRFAGGRETPQALVSQLWQLQYMGLPADYYQTHLDQIAGVKSADVIATAKRLVDEDHLVIVVVGPAKKLEKRLRKIAPVEIVDPKAKPPAG